MKRIIAVALILLSCHVAFAHSGGVDSKGGHTNRATGEYHYHHGYPAHQHENGVCPYDFDDKTGESSGSSSGSSGGSSFVSDTAFMHSDMKRGDRGTSVSRLQVRLNSSGYSCGTADGIFGSKTEKALKEFQSDHGLAVTGTANYVTLARLFPEKVPPTPTPRPTATPSPTPAPYRSRVFFDGIKSAYSCIVNVLSKVAYGSGVLIGLCAAAGTFFALVVYPISVLVKRLIDRISNR